jgi:hypothetical protein
VSDPAHDLVHSLRRQLEPCIEMLRRSMNACPDDLWDARAGGPPVWEQLYHTIFWLHAWLRDWSRPLEYPTFHVREALDMRGVPARVVSRAEMRGYLDGAVTDCASFLSALTPESVQVPAEAFRKQWTPVDRILGQVRHVQHHVGYLNAVLRAGGSTPVAWVGYQE